MVDLKDHNMLDFFTHLFRRTSKHARLPQSDTESLDNETLLPSSSSSSRSPLTLKPSSRPRFEYQVALKTLIVCSVVYLCAGFWVAYGVRKAEFVEDADEFCMNYVSQYCKFSSCKCRGEPLTDCSACGQGCSTCLAHNAVQRVILA